MKVLCVIDSLGSGGAQRQLVELAIGFKRNGHQVSFLVYHSMNFFKELLDENDIQVYEIIEPNYLKRLLKIRRFIRNGKFDSVLSFLQAANFICETAGLPWRKWKLVVGERSANPNIFKSFKLLSYRWVHLLADHIVANSYENIKMVRKINPLLSTDKCHVIYNIVDFEKWNSDHYCKSTVHDKFKLIVVASHRRLKNLDGLIEAVNMLSNEEKNKLQIDWYGEPDIDTSKYEAQLKIKKYHLDEVFKFYDPTIHIHEKVKQADAIGLFSFYEGLPNVICEAMAMGKPIISSWVSDVPKLISDEQLIFNPNNTEEISKTISNLMGLSQKMLQEIGNENYTNAVRLFDANSIINNYLKLLSSEN